jgi:CelD/BcsL family acetyltransferase involved in cellulose biosynthesis
MRITPIAPHEIDAGLQARWQALQDHPARPEWRHPFLSADLARLTGEVRPGTRVAVVEEGAQVVGLWAFELQMPGVARPLARHMSDLQCPLLDPDWLQTVAARRGPDAASGAVRAPAGVDPVWPALARAAGLRVVHYDHLLLPGMPECKSAQAAGPADLGRTGWMIDLRQGYAAYRRIQSLQTRWWRRTEGKARRMAESMGPLTLSNDPRDDEAWMALARWKSEQYRQSGLRDNFSIKWVRQWLDRLRWADSPRLRGSLQALRAGDRLVAVHFGLRGGDVLHHYLPAYDARVAMHSPGHLLLAQIVEQAAGEGLAWIDFSAGDMEFKQAVSNARRTLAQGALAPAWVHRLRHWTQRLETGLREFPGLLPVARHGRRAFVALSNGPSQWVQSR